MRIMRSRLCRFPPGYEVDTYKSRLMHLQLKNNKAESPLGTGRLGGQGSLLGIRWT